MKQERIVTWWPLTQPLLCIRANKLRCVNVLQFCRWNLILLENTWFNQENIVCRPPEEEINAENVFFALLVLPSLPHRSLSLSPGQPPRSERTRNEFVIIIMGLHATRITNKRMLCVFMLVVVVVRRAKTKNGSTSLNCTNNIKRFYNARLHAIFTTSGEKEQTTLCLSAQHCASSGLQSLISCGRCYAMERCVMWFRLSTTSSHSIVPFYFSYENAFSVFLDFYSARLSLMLSAIAFADIYFLCGRNSQDTCYNYRSRSGNRGAGEKERRGKMP